MMLTSDPTRLALLAGLTLGYAAVCLAPYLRQRRKRRAAQRERAALAQAPAWIVAYASQTGNAEELAGQTAQTLRLAGLPVRLCALAELAGADLQGAERVLFLVSTYGEGDAPDNAAAFLDRVMGAPLPLAQLHYAVLALGDSAYARFCGFGRALDQWLAAQGAARLFARVEVNRSAAAAIEPWFRQLSHLAGTSDAPDWSAPAFEQWRLAERRLLNPGSAGAPVYHIALDRGAGALPQWHSGDLVQVAAPADPARPREYSIASITQDGRVHLLVRLHAHPDGGLGLASGWLAVQAGIGEPVQLRLRQHRRFRLEDNAARPLILIGNGSGIAGLRGHLKSRALAGQKRNWLFFGERNAAHDFHYRDDIEQWQASGALARLDLAFSRDQAQRLYVQDRLLGNADEVAQWVGQGAAIYVCGSLNGMAGGVDAALRQILGRAALDALAAEGRYRRDVY
ncbi:MULTISPECIES: sulfite reductase subunit alpha [unclassified Janthinobacterium]|uniref:sulfite reductase subunit alpha n=1 Tax=unclassified Janthinobacterium TaxID=2610881 RepID=UPI00034C6268|nr:MULTISPECIES: sulfite reductase subunit alpha [unclassified Janthinobacterium]MEC5161423.1 sulfite reductase (NADPH) flavoprotein alpha-component [Janthinobacterium sp. CG_S6]